MRTHGNDDHSSSGHKENRAAWDCDVSDRAPLTRRDARELERRRPAARRRDTARAASPRRAAAAAPARRPSAVATGRGPRARRSARSILSLVAVLAVGALTVGTSLPINALIPIDTPVASDTPSTSARVQSMTVAEDAAAPAIPARDGFTVLSYQEQLRIQYGVQELTFTPTTGAVRWPFPYSVPISDYWGPRVAPCDGCSTFHKGVDFTPGSGAPIYAIADGVVALHEDTYGGLGNNVWIDHVINGQKITSVYAHMITGSSTLAVGDVVKVGDFIGQVGDTGSSTGAHLHFEILVQDVNVDPFGWLTANAVN